MHVACFVTKSTGSKKEARYLAYFFTKSTGSKRKPNTWLTLSQRVWFRKKKEKVLGLSCHKQYKDQKGTWLTLSQKVMIFHYSLEFLAYFVTEIRS